MSSRSTPSILFVDDYLPILRVYKNIAKPEAWKIFTADSPREAIKIAREHRPTLAIVDICLPEMDGYELCKKLLSLPEPMDVMVISGVFTTDEDRLNVFRTGAAAFLTKPVFSVEFRAHLRHFFSPLKPTRPLGSNGHVPDTSSGPPVLVIEDEEDQAAAIALHLALSGFTPYVESTASYGIMTAYRLAPRAIILDMGLPDYHGSNLVGILKAHPRTRDIPVLVWTGNQDKNQEVVCLKRGADEYLIKGIHAMEAIPLRIKKLIEGTEARGPVIRKGPLTMNLSARSIVMDSKQIYLTCKEFDLLAYLVGKSPAVTRWSDILTAVWRKSTENSSESSPHEAIEARARTLRAKLGKAGTCIVTHKGVGLQFDSGPFRRHPAE